MSVIRKKPFIEEVVDLLTISQKEALLLVMNTAGNNVPASLLEMPEKGIKPVLFKFDEANIKTGILIYLDDVPVTLIAYHRFQDVLLFRLYPNEDRYEKVNEYCDINELRRILGVGNEVTAGEIISGATTPANKVLVSDGDGGAHWVDTASTIKEDDVEAGDAVKLFGFDAEGNLVADDIPEGITVSNTLSPITEDVAVSGPAVAGYTYSKDETDALLETKANVDGNYPTMTVGVADQLSPYDDESGDDQDEPFSFQATGTGNGTQPDFSTGAIALMKEKCGNSVVVNQQVKNPTFIDSSNWYEVYGTLVISNNSATLTSTSDNDGSIHQSIGYNIGNKHLLLFDALSNANNVLRVGIDLLDSDQPSYQIFGGDVSLTTTKQTVARIIQPTANSTTGYGLTFRLYATAGNSFTISNVYIIDLTQWFGSNDNIPSDLLSHPENFFRYYQGSLAYNAGTLVNANGRYVKCIGRNQWDEEYVNGYYDENDANATFYSYTNYIASKNPIKVIPNTDYYIKSSPVSGATYILYFDKDGNYLGNYSYLNDGTFTTPANCCSIKFYFNNGSNVYSNNVTISIYYEGESGYDQYYPYEVLTNNDTGTETLRSAGSVADIKLPSGEIIRNVGIVDLGSFANGDYSYDNEEHRVGIYNTGLTLPNYLNSNLISSKYIYDVRVITGTGNAGDKTICCYENNIYIKDLSWNSETDIKQALNGVYLFYELATPTTEQGTPYSENLFIDDFGSMDFQGTNGVPQGNLIFYPVDYKAFIDTLYNYTDGTPSELAKKSDLASDKQELSTVDTQLQNAIGGTLRHCLAIQESGLDFDDTDFVDLGELSWSNADAQDNSTLSFDISTLVSIPASSETAKIITTKYKTVARDNLFDKDNSICINTGGYIVIYSTSNAGKTGTQIKASLKGVLLAYEKASS